MSSSTEVEEPCVDPAHFSVACKAKIDSLRAGCIFRAGERGPDPAEARTTRAGREFCAAAIAELMSFRAPAPALAPDAAEQAAAVEERCLAAGADPDAVAEALRRVALVRGWLRSADARALLGSDAVLTLLAADRAGAARAALAARDPGLGAWEVRVVLECSGRESRDMPSSAWPSPGIGAEIDGLLAARKETAPTPIVVRFDLFRPAAAADFTDAAVAGGAMAKIVAWDALHHAFVLGLEPRSADEVRRDSFARRSPFLPGGDEWKRVRGEGVPIAPAPAET